MFFKTVLLATTLALVEARFNQEQIPIPAIAAVQGGDPGVAPTIAGAAISDLLAAANPCAKLKRGDEIIQKLGTGADSIAAAIGMVVAEQNFNPFNIDRPTFCNDPTLPQTAILRGRLPKVDPNVTNADLANQLSAQSVDQQFDADGLSVADILAQNGFTTFNTKDAAGANGPTGDELAGGGGGGNGGGNGGAAGGAAGGGAAGGDAADGGAADGGADGAAGGGAADPAETPCPPDVTVTVTVTAAPAETGAPGGGNEDGGDDTPPEDNTPPAAGGGGAGDGVTTSTIPGVDFGTCNPGMDFKPGRPGRKADESTFLPVDPAIKARQSDALNPGIIANRICDDLTNICGANQAAKDLCRQVQAAVDTTVRNASTAEKWNAGLGFAGVPATRRRALDSADALRRRSVEGVKRRSARVM